MEDREMPERQLVFYDFADKVGDAFTLVEEDVLAIELRLQAAEALDPKMSPFAARRPFSLLFTAMDPRVLPQRIYRLAHEALGDLSLFIVPVAKEAAGVTYQATFN
jgi:hypothetical protein